MKDKQQLIVQTPEVKRQMSDRRKLKSKLAHETSHSDTQKKSHTEFICSEITETEKQSSPEFTHSSHAEQSNSKIQITTDAQEEIADNLIYNVCLDEMCKVISEWLTQVRT